MNAENNSCDLLNELSDEINKLYGYVKIAGNNFGEPAINSGPCGPFANAFFKLWNLKFTEKVNIVFIMVKNSDECWHVLIRLPNGLLYDGGHGVHNEEMYSDKFDIEDMIEYDINLLEKRSCGLDRKYPRYCPSFSINTVEDLIEKYLNLIDRNITFEKITPEYPMLGSMISSSIGLPTPEKIAQVLQSYEQPNQFLIGAFSAKNLIAVIGFQLNNTQATIKHISVLNEFKKQGIGKSLVHRLIKVYKPSTVSLETDGEAVKFYETLGFICQVFNGDHGNRYRCYLNLLPSQATASFEPEDREWHMNDPLINLYRQAEDYFFRGISSKCLNLDDGANAYMTGGAGLNFIYITRDTNVLDKILIQGQDFYDKDNLSFEVIIPQKLCTPQIVGILNTMGYPQKSKSVSMVVNLDRFVINKTGNFDAEIRIKANDDQLSDWMMPLIGAFESTFEICSMYANTHESALKKNINLHHFSLYKQEKPIASITLSLNNDIARIDDVGTLPEFQGKGYATHLMHHVLSEAKKLGARHCFLESSDSGLGVYQKLGFEPLFKNNIYSRKA